MKCESLDLHRAVTGRDFMALEYMTVGDPN